MSYAEREKHQRSENDSRLQLNLMDYVARLYNPLYGQLPGMDPHAENYYTWSPYAYVGDNPLRITDPTGMDWYEDDKGNLQWRNDRSETYEDDDDITWNNVGKTMSFRDGNITFNFSQEEDDDGNLTLSSKRSSIEIGGVLHTYDLDKALSEDLFERMEAIGGAIGEQPLDMVHPEGIVLFGAKVGGATVTGLKAFKNTFDTATGGLKQWLRIGGSYSHNLGSKTQLSIRWGASPKYAKKIGSGTLRDINQSLRTMKLPGHNWRVKDPGHLHIKK